MRNSIFFFLLMITLLLGCTGNGQNQDLQDTNNQDKNPQNKEKKMHKKITYIALGDSYTKGEGILSDENYPNQLVNKLNVKGYEVTLVANPSETGWTTTQVIDYELPVIKEHNPDIITLLIGVNDWVQGKTISDFETNYQIIIQTLLETHSNHQLLLITIPDFSYAPKGPLFSNGRDISKGIEQFNTIIDQIGQQHNITVVDIYPLSQRQRDPGYYAADRLHYSASAYEQWTDLILPEVELMIQ